MTALALMFEPWMWLYIFIAATTLDAALTLYGLKLGIAEANPLMRVLMRAVGAPVALAFSKMLGIATFAAMYQMWALYMPLYVLAYIAVCAWNIVQITRKLT
jgi:hypothetical protein